MMVFECKTSGCMATWMLDQESAEDNVEILSCPACSSGEFEIVGEADVEWEEKAE